MSKFGLWVVAAIAVFTLLYLVYLAATFEAPTGTTTVVVPTTVVPAAAEPAPVIAPRRAACCCCGTGNRRSAGRG